MQLNRELQKEILLALTNAYPGLPDDNIFNRLVSRYDEFNVMGNILYLKKHKLISIRTMSFKNGMYHVGWRACEPTEKAFDFLAEDGGLSAILNVVTVKLHADTIKALILAKIEADNTLNEEEKSSLKEALNNIGQTALTTITEKAIEAIPVAALLAVLQSFIS